jgi:hypothetical protein
MDLWFNGLSRWYTRLSDDETDFASHAHQE